MGGWEVTKEAGARGTYVLASWLFLRLLGVIYLVAFVSLATQIRGLVGKDGILPAAEVFNSRRHWGVARFFHWPSLCWLDSSDRALLWLSWGGAFLAVLLIIGFAPIPILALLWVFYLSLFTACGLFLCYQWDILLLEAGFLALFLAPPQIVPQWPARTTPSSISIWLFWWLLFRLMFWSGAVKLRSGDAAWRNLTALKFHYESQPLPTPLAWHLHQLPAFFHKCSAVVVFAIELAAPFLIITPPPWRYGAAGLFVFLMILIELTGNYAFFNSLGIALSVLLLDDSVLLPVFRFALADTHVPVLAPPLFSQAAAAVVTILVLLLSLDSIARLLRVEFTWPQPIARFFGLMEPLRLVNSYGLFAIMTTWRPEIILEGSNDGIHWEEYQFKYKPGDVGRPPRFVAPYQPRLDWQMWFAALGTPLSYSWFDRFRARLLEGSPAVLSLLRSNPFPQAPPRYIRGVLYDYRFTNPVERRATGVWWQRQRRGIFEG
jgi:hypothetical protein